MPTTQVCRVTYKYYSHICIHNEDLTYYFMPRVITRAIMVDFSLPAVGPQTDHEDEAFAELEELLSSGCVSKAIGWAIRTGKELEGKREITYFSQKFKGVFSGRICKNWAMLLFFVDKVSIIIHYCPFHVSFACLVFTAFHGSWTGPRPVHW